MDQINVIVSEIIREYNLNSEIWYNLKYTLIANSGNSPSFRLEHIVSDQDQNVIDCDIAWLNNISNVTQQIFIELNKEEKINKLIFHFENRILSRIERSWDQIVQDEFELYLPKSKKGKIKAWYLPEDQISTIQEQVEPYALASFKKHLVQLPLQEPPIPDEQLTDKPLQELYKLLDPYLIELENPLWDGGVIGIKKDKNGVFSGVITIGYNESEEDREAGRADYEEAPLPVVTERMKSIYEVVQAETKRLYPGITWDALFVSIYPDGFAEANFEYQGKEVYIE